MRVPTGIPGLDALTQGGFPRNSVNLVSGPAGSGKSLFGIQYFYNGARDYDETSILLVFEENRGNIERAMRDFDMDLKEYERREKLYLIDLGEIRIRSDTNDKRGVIGFRELQDFLEGYIESLRPKRLVIDSISAVGLYYRSPEDLREEMFSFTRFLREKEVTSLLVTESIEGRELTRYGIEQFVADSFIVMGLEEVKGELRRTLTVRKMRFTRHDTAKHPFLIGPKGIEVSAEEKVI